MNPNRLLARVSRGDVKIIKFADFERLAVAMGFNLRRTEGGHRVYRHPMIDEMLVLQPGRDGDAKPYQVRQLARLIEQYALQVEG